jgi:hypothetical protein
MNVIPRWHEKTYEPALNFLKHLNKLYFRDMYTKLKIINKIFCFQSDRQKN